MTAGASAASGVIGRARARAGTNIALVKYWGKRDRALNLPAAGSLSLTLDGLGSDTEVTFLAGRPAGPNAPDEVLLDGQPADATTAARVSRFLDLVRARAGSRAPARVRTHNSVPTAAGLASSASGFAALALAATRAARLDLSPRELSELARRGSGSAARSIFGGLVELHAGSAPDGGDAVAEQILPPGAWDLRLVVAITSDARKALSSTAAMERTANSSPYFPAWVDAVAGDLAAARAAIAARDLDSLGAVTERSCLRMHACALAADPGVLYWNPVTVALIHAVRALREAVAPAYFTIDAGPHVKVLCAAAHADAVRDRLAAVPGVLRTLVAGPGPGVQLVSADAPSSSPLA